MLPLLYLGTIAEVAGRTGWMNLYLQLLEQNVFAAHSEIKQFSLIHVSIYCWLV